MRRTTTESTPSQTSLYVCLDCGNGIEGDFETEDCPNCGGRLLNTTVPHD
ncbi:rubrerythrin-like domain-containing protein [Halonotius terrestris]|uniref:Rubrerythrin-like domain-containing protein n=1 Tax=Halonotius terrestris TaxID=2487750 RepID=A0A8J8PAR8_9EURY|nr:rubrerythrin-like domain-containing protein [Halonotius terrestris]TQQ82930.1 rubrerythrin-like domain-containing protein [Halonotius terrestris]